MNRFSFCRWAAARQLRSIQARSYLGDAGIGASLVLFAARGPGDADRADYLVADLDQHAATHRNYVRDLLQKSVLRLISQILELKRGLAASASRISLEPAKFDGVRIGPVAADGRSDIASLINDHERHFHRNVLLDLWSLRTGRRGERE